MASRADHPSLESDTGLNTSQLSMAVDLLRSAYLQTLIEGEDAYEQWLYAVNTRLSLAERGFVEPNVAMPRPWFACVPFPTLSTSQCLLPLLFMILNI